MADMPREGGKSEADEERTSGAPRIAVCAVTRNAVADLAPWWESLAAQEGAGPFEISVVDSASSDDTPAQLDRLVARAAARGVRFGLRREATNVGFAEGMNRAIAATAAPWILSLNVDTRPRPDFLRRLLARAEMHSPWRIAAATGRLERFPEIGSPAVLDACGMRLSLGWRHLDRGSGKVDDGEYPLCERVFGGTGAATLFRRAALDDVAIGGSGGPIFDPYFHSFREDAELCFRLRERGWEIVFEPSAVALHRRSVVPRRRSALDPAINYHSLKNRYLLRAYHQTWATRLLTFLPATVRDLAAFCYVLVFERSSLAAYGWLWRERAAVRARARAVRARRSASAWSVARWFLDEQQSI
jgi:GT2 family glycosyltransferase